MNERRTNKHIELFVAVIFLLVAGYSSAYGQTSWTIQGQLLDEEGAPLQEGLVYIQVDTTAGFSVFANSDKRGFFTLNIAEQHQSVRLFVRYLGYKPWEKDILQIDTVYVTVQMTPHSADLEEVVVVEEYPPVVNKSDTTAYTADYYRDSTEFVVEELLDKMPGIEVGENGSIKVNGKDIHKVLVEGADLFGRNYTIGTQNIRADYIARVEVIDHFQENPVLRDVNYSDDVVLNLLFEEDKKNVWTGTANIGTGAGGEGKLAGHLNVFSISEKQKFVFLSDNGNVGNHYSVGEIDAAYGTHNEQDITSLTTDFQHWLSLPRLENPGVPNELIDNSINAFGTVRSEQSINDQWVVKANALLQATQDQQLRTWQTNYLFDESTFSLDTEEKVQIKDVFGGADVLLRHTSKNLNRSVHLWADWQTGDKNREWDILRQNQDTVISALNTFRNEQNQWTLAGQLTQKLKSRSVLQIEWRQHRQATPGILTAENPDLLQFFGSPTLRQRVQYDFYKSEILGRWMWTSKRVLLKIEPAYHFVDADRQITYPQQEIDPLAESNRQSGFQVKGYMQYQLTKQDVFSFTGSLGEDQLKNLTFGESNTFTRQRINAQWQRDWTDHIASQIAFTQYRQPPKLPEYFFGRILSDPFTLYQVGPRNQSYRGKLVRFRLAKKAGLDMRSWNINISYHFDRHHWWEGTRFNRSIMEQFPYFSGGNQQFSARVYFSQFIPSIKTSLEVRPAFRVAASNLNVDDALALFQFQTADLFFKTSTRVFNRFQCIFEQQVHSTQSANHDFIQHNSQWRSSVTGLYRIGNDVQLSMSYYRLQAFLRNQNRAVLNALTAKIKLTYTWKKRPLHIRLQLSNLLFSEEYQTIYRNDFFISNRSVEAIPPFFVLRLDYGF